jgi:hypothetical protein
LRQANALAVWECGNGAIYRFINHDPRSLSSRGERFVHRSGGILDGNSMA